MHRVDGNLRYWVQRMQRGRWFQRDMMTPCTAKFVLCNTEMYMG